MSTHALSTRVARSHPYIPLPGQYAALFLEIELAIWVNLFPSSWDRMLTCVGFVLLLIVWWEFEI